MAGGLLRGVSVYPCRYGRDDAGVSAGRGGGVAGVYGEAVDRGGWDQGARGRSMRWMRWGWMRWRGMAVYSGAMEA